MVAREQDIRSQERKEMEIQNLRAFAKDVNVDA